MAKVHLWVGNFRSARLFQKFLDQKAYLAAWAAYDHGPPAGDGQDTEPDPAGRCAFCAEVNLDSFDEDALIMKHFTKPASLARVASDLIVDEKRLGALLNKHGIDQFNSVISYQDARLAKKDAARATSVRYLGQLAQLAGDDEGPKDAVTHYLWVGSSGLDKQRILAQIGVDRRDVVGLDFFHSDDQMLLDDLLILRVDNLFVAENMILKLDKMKIRKARSVLHLALCASAAKFNAEQDAATLGLRYVGKFRPD
ncbi:immunity 22 family protein [Variovorax sp. LT1R20]|uniref:immunity 22 family protein n=1 Tax=Variovorax sp. LT1R20 TaxID=3443729 RepID=UPI003F468B1D